MHSPNNKTVDEFKKHQELILPVTQKYLGNKNLDIGCGNGITSLIHQQKLGISPTLCDIVDIRAGATKNLPFFLLKSGKLPFADKEFDSSYFQYILHHIPRENVSLLIQEASRVSSRIIIVEEVKSEKTNMQKALNFDQKVNSIIHPDVVMQVFQYFTVEEIKKFLEITGRPIEFFMISEGTEENGFIDTCALIS